MESNNLCHRSRMCVFASSSSELIIKIAVYVLQPCHTARKDTDQTSAMSNDEWRELMPVSIATGCLFVELCLARS